MENGNAMPPIQKTIVVEPRLNFETEEQVCREYCWNHLELYPLACREYICNPEWVLASRELPNDCLTYWCSGLADLYIHGQHYELKGGELFLVGRGEEHHIVPVKRSRCRMCNLHFKALVDGAFDFARDWGLCGVYECAEITLPQSFLELQNVLQCGEPGGEAYAKALIRMVLYQIAVRKAKAPRKRDMRVDAALGLIREKFSDPGISLARMARRMNVSQVYCRQLFRKYCGRSPLEHLQKVRLEHAELLLRTSDLTVKQIADLCGFSDMNFFYRVFKRSHGMTPREFRQHCRLSLD